MCTVSVNIFVQKFKISKKVVQLLCHLIRNEITFTKTSFTSLYFMLYDLKQMLHNPGKEKKLQVLFKKSSDRFQCICWTGRRETHARNGACTQTLTYQQLQEINMKKKQCSKVRTYINTYNNDELLNNIDKSVRNLTEKKLSTNNWST